MQRSSLTKRVGKIAHEIVLENLWPTLEIDAEILHDSLGAGFVVS